MAGSAPRPPVRRRALRPRALVIQAAVLLAVVAVVVWFAQNTIENLAARNLTSGFGFLSHTAGFAISQSLIPYTEQSTYARALAVGLLNTLLVAVLGIAFATVLGFVIGIARLARNPLVAGLAGIYVEVFRNLPLLLQIFVWYFAVLQPLPKPRQAISLFDVAFLHSRGLQLPLIDLGPAGVPVLLSLVAGFIAAWLWAERAARRRERTGQGGVVLPVQAALVLVPPVLIWLALGAPLTVELPELRRFNFEGGVAVRPEFIALLVALSTYTAAFIAEIVRAGILAVPRGQTEAAAALGLGRGQVLRLVVIPQAMRVIIPPLTNQYLNLTKNSSLAVAIAYPDLVSVFAGTALSQSGQAVEIIAMTMAIYLALSLLTSLSMNFYNARFALRER